MARKQQKLELINTLEYLGIWGGINNPDFNYPEFGVIIKESGVNRFIMSAR